MNLKVQSVRFPEPEPCKVTLLQLQGSLLLMVIDAGGFFFVLEAKKNQQAFTPIGFYNH